VNHGQRTGIVHLSPAFRRGGLAVARRNGLPVVNRSAWTATSWPTSRSRGLFFLTPRVVIAELESRRLLVKHEPYPHSYPHAGAAHRADLLRAAACVHPHDRDQGPAGRGDEARLHPAIKHRPLRGLAEQQRGLGFVPHRSGALPCRSGASTTNQLTCVGSLQELFPPLVNQLKYLDPHRPFVDEITFPCPDCHTEARRVPAGIDVWYDSGAMPFAQWGAPHQNLEEFEAPIRAVHCEAIDQTRGWFYSDETVGTLCSNSPRTRRCVLG